MLKPIPIYPAYIKDQYGALWGIPATLMGEYDKERITIETTEGVTVPASEIDMYTVAGDIYIVHKYTEPSGNEGEPLIGCIDTYKQSGGAIELVQSAPDKPAETRAQYDGIDWHIETTIVNGAPSSYLYSRNAELMNAMGNYSGKGAYVRAWPMISGFVILDRGIVVMTDTAAFFVQWGRTSPEFVSETGRLWK